MKFSLLLCVSLATSTCVYQTSTRLIGSQITLSNAQAACRENLNCLDSVPLVSYSESSNLALELGCESSTRPVRNCTGRGVVASSLWSLIDYPLSEPLPLTIWTNTMRSGEYQACTSSPGSRYFTGDTDNEAECESTKPILCACFRYVNRTSVAWVVEGVHFRRLNGSFMQCNASLAVGSILYENSQLTIYSPDTVALANGTNLTASWTSFQSASTNLSRLSSGTFKLETLLAPLRGYMVNSSCSDAPLYTGDLSFCPKLSYPFSRICSRDFATQGGTEDARYLLTTEFMDFLGVPYPLLAETSAPTKSPTKKPTSKPTGAPSKAPSRGPIYQIPSASPTTSFPSSSPTRSPTKTRPTQSPSRSPSKSPTKLPTRSPTKTPTNAPV